MDIKVYYNDSNTPYADIVSVIRDAFDERSNKGMMFSCAHFTAEEFKEHTHNSYVICALDEGSVVGTLSLGLREGRGMFYGVHEYLAVKSSYKHSGVASVMFLELLKIANSNTLDCIVSDTAVGAISSVRYHKKMGFKTIRLQSFPTTNYYSYGFVFPLRKLRILNWSFIRIPVFVMSYLTTLIMYRKDGSKRFL